MQQRELPGQPVVEAVRREALRRPSRSGFHTARRHPSSAKEGGSFVYIKTATRVEPRSKCWNVPCNRNIAGDFL